MTVFWRYATRRDHVAFVGTVLAAYLSVFFRDEPLLLSSFALVTGLCLLYTVIGIFGFEIVAHQPPLAKAGYFLVQLGLGPRLFISPKSLGKFGF